METNHNNEQLGKEKNITENEESKTKDKEHQEGKCKQNGFIFHKLFFSKYTFVGVILILLSIITSMTIPPEIYSLKNIVLKIVSSLLEAMGVAFVMGAIFDFSKNTSEFTEFISNVLSNIVISKEFLSRLTMADKTKALSLLLKPTNNQLDQYSNINDYFYKKIKEATEMFGTNFKSHLSVSVEAKYGENGKIKVSGIIRYRIYKIQDKYKPLSMIFDDNQGVLKERRILHPKGIENVQINDDTSVSKKKTEGGLEYTEYEFEIPLKLIEYKYLTIESRIEEEGEDHWIIFNWTSLTPYDGLSFTLICSDDLIIKKKTLFDNKEKYIFTESNNKKRLDICSTDWLDAYTGFSLLIAKEKPDENT